MEKAPEIKTSWIYEERMEICRLIEMANRIAVGFYESKGFKVMPWKKDGKVLSPSIVTFPDLEYKRIPRFWQKVLNIGYYNFPIDTPENFIQEIKMLVTNSQDFKLKAPNYSKVKEDWDQINADLLSFINNIFPKHKKIESLEIYLSLFGTTSTFTLIEKYPARLRLYLRHDASIYHIVFGILSAITRRDVFTKLNGGWEESQLLVDWLLSQTKLAQRFNDLDIKITPSLKHLSNKQNAALTKKSNDFLHKLGIAHTFDFEYDEKNNILINKNILNKLTNKEKEALKIFIDKRGNVVTHDDLASILFTNNNDFSLYAISKFVERLRSKLEKNNVSSTFIQTKRGEGYSLV